ncbi:hypothetical protein BJY01DRAFT_223721 [Aspergillus pseudoustus]|uniref:Uncharacterized protein n=1 Tax=Aspergillus pseudoustus TaxID=1810923 RepID=A0ABR4J6M9_9EURO
MTDCSVFLLCFAKRRLYQTPVIIWETRRRQIHEPCWIKLFWRLKVVTLVMILCANFYPVSAQFEYPRV